MRYFRKSEVQVPIYFMIISILWIIYSDRFFLTLGISYSLPEITHIQTLKGCFYVVGVAILIHFMIKSSNKKLVRSQEEYKELFYNTPNPMLIFDSKTQKFCNINKAAIEVYGYSAEEFKGMSVSNIRCDTANNTVLMRNRPGNVYEHKKKNKEIIICMETTREISFKNTSVCLLSTYDITELEKAKIELTQRENQLKLILNSITDGFFILSNDFVIEMANQEFKKIVEVPVDHVEGKKFTDLFPNVQTTFSYAQYSKAIETKKAVHFETFSSLTKSWYRVSAYPYDGGLCVMFRDITKEKDDELHKYQNQQNLIALINNTEDLIWSIDSNFRYFTFNEPYQQVYKQLFQEDLWIGKVALNERQGQEHIEKWKGLYERALKGEKFFIEMELVVDNNSHFTTVRFNPIYNADQEVVGVGCFLQNITERKLYERRIEQQNEQLKQVAFITSHQVRAPLANILGLIEILDKEDPSNSSNQEIIQHIKTSAEQLDRTIINMVQQTTQVRK